MFLSSKSRNKDNALTQRDATRHNNAVLTVRLKWARSSGQCVCLRGDYCLSVFALAGRTQNRTIYGAAGDCVRCEHLGADAGFLCYITECITHSVGGMVLIGH